MREKYGDDARIEDLARISAMTVTSFFMVFFAPWRSRARFIT